MQMNRRRFTSKAEKAFSGLLVNLRRFISLLDLFPLAPANRPWVSEELHVDELAKNSAAVRHAIPRVTNALSQINHFVDNNKRETSEF